MWKIVNETPFEAKGAIRLDPKTSRKQWLVAVKATFDLHQDGALSISEKQEEVLDDPVYRGDEETSSLLYDSDLFGLKKKVDVLLNATAYQPGGKADTKLTVVVGVGDWSKTLKIVGKRLWDRFLGTSLVIDPDPFVKLPVTYENAFGGRDESAKPHLQTELGNPVGKGYAVGKARLHGQELPNIEYPEYPTKASFDKNKVAGFGAIPVCWQPRNGYGGTFDEAWQQERSPFLPLDCAPGFFQSAPEDQQLNQLTGGEPVLLYNLMPNHPEFRFRLPNLAFMLTTKIGCVAQNHTASLQTLILEPDMPRLILVWQSAIDCQDKNQLVDQTTINCRIKSV